MRDLDRKRMGGRTGPAIHPEDNLKNQMRDPVQRQHAQQDITSRRDFYDNSLKHGSPGPGGDYKCVVAWKQFEILKEVFRVYEEIEAEAEMGLQGDKPGEADSRVCKILPGHNPRKIADPVALG